MNTLLVPVDFSKNSENALGFALDFAVEANYKVVLFNVCPLPYEFAVRIEEAVESLEHYSKKQLDVLISKIGNDPKYAKVQCEGFTTVGKTVSSILEFASSNKVSLIAMATKGASGIAKMLIGSNTTEIIRRSEIPVLVIPEKASFHMLDKIVYALDYHVDSVKSIERMIGETKKFGKKTYTVHVAAKENLMERMLHRNLQILLNDTFHNDFQGHELIFNESAIKGLDGYLSEKQNVLLVLTPHTRSYWQSISHKSISQEMAYHASTPLLVIN